MARTRTDKEPVPLVSDVQSTGPICMCEGSTPMELDLWHSTTSYMKGLIHPGIGDWREYDGLSW